MLSTFHSFAVLVQSQFTRVIPDQAFPGRSVSMVLSNATHVTLLGGTTSGTPDVDGLQAVPVVFDVGEFLSCLVAWRRCTCGIYHVFMRLVGQVLP